MKKDVSFKQASLPGPFFMYKDIFIQVGGLPNKNCGEDVGFIPKLQKYNYNPEKLLCKPGFIYRWGTGFYHISGYGEDNQNKISGYEKVKITTEKRISEKLEPSGDVLLKPHWNNNWVELTKNL